MTSFRPLLHAAAPAAHAARHCSATRQQAAARPRLTTIDLAAEASRPAANDLARATVFAEASGATPSELAKRVNGLISRRPEDGQDLRQRPNVQSGATHTYPVYGKGNRIEGWRMRSELTLESRDSAALSELLGKLQTSLGVANLIMLPSGRKRAGKGRKRSHHRRHRRLPAARQDRSPTHSASLPDQAPVDQQQRSAARDADDALGSDGFGRCRTDADRGRRNADPGDDFRPDRS
jgi:hypothetical protein